MIRESLGSRAFITGGYMFFRSIEFRILYYAFGRRNEWGKSDLKFSMFNPRLPSYLE